MKKLFSIALWAVFFALTVVSCKVQEIDKTDSLKTQDITIEEAKMWMQSQKAGARVAGGSKTTRTEYWSGARKLNYANGSAAVVVPLSYNYENRTVFMDGKPANNKKLNKRDFFFESKLFVYKDAKGNMQADVVRFIPEVSTRKGNKKIDGKDFSGYVLAYDQTENTYLGGWYYQKGESKGRVRLNGSTKMARIASSPCDILIYEAADTDRPAKLGTGAPAPDFYYDQDGIAWVLSEVIAMPCGSGSTNNTNNTSNNNTSNNNNTNTSGTSGANTAGYGQPGWTWYSGGGNSQLPTNWSPFTMDMLGDFGVVSFSAADNFFLTVLINKGIAFDEVDQELIRNDFGLWGKALTDYINSSGQKPDLSAFTLNTNNATDQQVINAINSLMEEPGVPKGITNDELILLGLGTAQFRANLNKYYQDAKDATQRAIWRYSYAEAQEQGLSRANAFKHALFAILHARSFGRQLAQQLANEHEEYDISQSPANYSIETQMDLWNNQEGFNIYDSNPNRQISEFDNAVFQGVTNGNMRYVSGGFLTPTY
jgi:hypothetical protein